MPSISAIIQIAILYFVIYGILKGARGSRFGQVLTGIGLLAALMALCSYLFDFKVIAIIIKFLLIYLAISSVVIFQPEIRRILATVGALGFFEKPKHYRDGSVTAELLVETIFEMSKQRMGALIAFERGISLKSYEKTGVELDSIFSRELVQCIFTPPLPLHDGGMIIRNGRIASSHCLFPVSNNPSLVNIGMRHRAAVGLSEETDALVVVISEERGTISIAHNGKLFRYSPNDPGANVGRWVKKALRSDARGGGIVPYLLGVAQKAVAAILPKGARK